MLSIGAGDGRFEMSLVDQCHDMNVTIKHLDLYEPDSIHFDMIKNMKWNDFVHNVEVFNETVKADTTYPRKYDWIILSHVCYYFQTEVIKLILLILTMQNLILFCRKKVELYLKALLKPLLRVEQFA